jgi:hypothetical protein
LDAARIEGKQKSIQKSCFRTKAQTTVLNEEKNKNHIKPSPGKYRLKLEFDKCAENVGFAA